MKINNCTNILKFYILNNFISESDRNILIFQIHEEFRNIFSEIEIDFNDFTQIKGYTDWVAPVIDLERISNKYKIDIIGVAFDFQEAYAEAFDIIYQISEEEKSHFISMVSINEENTSTFPIDGDEEILNEEVDINPIDLNDESILN